MSIDQERAAALGLSPVFWYDIPHGYLQLDVYPSNERMEEMAREIRALPEEARDRADQVFRLYALVMWELQKRRVQGCALGMHPDDAGGLATSVLTLFSVELQGVNAKAALTTLMAAGAEGTTENPIVPVELPCGPGFLTASVRNIMAPGRSPEDADEPPREPVWQGMVAIPDPRSSSVIVVQLVTAAVELADDYRNVLLGVARTVTFTRPGGADGETPEPTPGSGAEAVRNDFG